MEDLAPDAPPSASDTIDAIRDVAEAVSVDLVWQKTLAYLGRHGFERVNYGFTRYRVGLGIGDPKDVLFLSSHSLDKVIAFHTSGLYLRSADYRWVRENVGACSWGFLKEQRAEGQLSLTEVSAMDELNTPRARAGYTISFAESLPRSKGAVGMAAPYHRTQAEVDAYWADHGAQIEAFCNTAHLKLSQMPLPVPGADITPRQRELLNWIADGKTMQDICVLTGLSLSAVEKTLKRARRALGVETTAQAVAKASFFNQLFADRLDDPG